MKQFVERLGRTDWKGIFAFPGAKVEDIKIQDINLAGNKQIIVTNKLTATQKALGFSQGEFCLRFEDKFDVRNLKSSWDAGILTIEVGLDKGVAKEHKVES